MRRSCRRRFALTLDAFYGKFKEVQQETELQTLILCRIPDYLALIKKIAFNTLEQQEVAKLKAEGKYCGE